jgi:hypothetical protein
LGDAKTPAQIQLAIPSSITDEQLQTFYLSRLREVIFGTDLSKHWYDDFEALGLFPLLALSRRKTGVPFMGTLDGINRTFRTPDKYEHRNGLSIDVFHNGRRLVEASVPSPEYGDFVCTESGGVGTGFDTIVLLTFTPSVRSVIVADYQVAL